MEEVDIDEGIVVGGDGDEDDGDESDIEATQHEAAELLKRIEKSRTGTHKPNEAEGIKSIDLVNFMVLQSCFSLTLVSPSPSRPSWGQNQFHHWTQRFWKISYPDRSDDLSWRQSNRNKPWFKLEKSHQRRGKVPHLQNLS